MKLVYLNPQRVFDLVRKRQQLKELFADASRYLAFLSDPTFPMPGIQVTLAEDKESIQIDYQSVTVKLVLTTAHVDGQTVGKVTGLLVRHPLIEASMILGSFTFNRSGEAKLTQPPNDVRDIYLGSRIGDVVYTLLELALHFDPEAEQEVAVHKGSATVAPLRM